MHQATIAGHPSLIVFFEDVIDSITGRKGMPGIDILNGVGIRSVGSRFRKT